MNDIRIDGINREGLSPLKEFKDPKKTFGVGGINGRSKKILIWGVRVRKMKERRDGKDGYKILQEFKRKGYSIIGEERRVERVSIGEGWSKENLKKLEEIEGGVR